MNKQQVLDMIRSTDPAIDDLMAEIEAADDAEAAYLVCRNAQQRADTRTDAGRQLNAAASRGLDALQLMDANACRRAENEWRKEMTR